MSIIATRQSHNQTVPPNISALSVTLDQRGQRRRGRRRGERRFRGFGRADDIGDELLGHGGHRVDEQRLRPQLGIVGQQRHVGRRRRHVRIGQVSMCCFRQTKLFDQPIIHATTFKKFFRLKNAFLDGDAGVFYLGTLVLQSCFRDHVHMTSAKFWGF